MDKRTSGFKDNCCNMFSGYKGMLCQGLSMLIRPLSPRSFVCIVLLCGVSVVVLNSRTTKIQEFTTLFIRMNKNVLTVRDVERMTSLQTVETTTFPSDILHDWKDNDRHALAVYILSAIGFNSKKTRHGFQADIKLTGWVAKKHRQVAIKCCILLTTGGILQFRELTYNVNTSWSIPSKRNTNLTAHQYGCHLNRHIDYVRGVALQFNKLRCPMRHAKYIKPFIPKKITTEESFAICLKIVYEQVDHVKLKDWLEYNRGIGVDKVFMYTYNISQATSNVLRHFIKQGFVEKRPFAYPWNNTRHIGEKTKAVWEDERVVISDCQQRLSRYKYLAVIDVDEYLVPRKHEDIKTMMKELMKRYPLAGGFRLYAYIFDKDVRPDSDTTSNHPDFLRYFKRTTGLIGRKSRSKNIVLPTRITVQGYNTHRFEPMPGYETVVMNTSIATLNHYRHCYSDLNETCSQLTTDTFMRKFYKIVRKNNEHRDKHL